MAASTSRTVPATFPQLIVDGAVVQRATDLIDNSGHRGVQPTPGCGRDQRVAIPERTLSNPVGVTISGSACLAVFERVEASGGATSSYTHEFGIKDLDLHVTVTDLTASLDGFIVDLFKLDSLITAIPGFFARPTLDYGLYASISVSTPVSFDVNVTGTEMWSSQCTPSCGVPHRIEHNSKVTTTPNSLDKILDPPPTDEYDISFALGPGLEAGLELINPATEGTVGTIFPTEVRVLGAVRGATTPEPEASAEYPFLWSVYAEVEVSVGSISTSLSTWFGSFTISGPSFEMSVQAPVIRSDEFAFTNYEDSLEPFPTEIQSGVPFDEPLVANVVQVDGQIDTDDGRFRHPSALAGIEVTAALHPSVEGTTGPEVVEGLTGDVTATSDSVGKIVFADDLAIAPAVPGGTYVIVLTAPDPDGKPFVAGDDKLSGTSPPFQASSGVTVAVGAGWACELSVAGTVSCRDISTFQEGFIPPVPDGQFRQIDGAHTSLCGIRVSGELWCSGGDPPSGEFSQVSSGRDYACAVAVPEDEFEGGEIACWGVNDSFTNSSGEATPPSGRFTQVAAGWAFTCGVTVDEIVLCWGKSTFSPGGRRTNTSRWMSPARSSSKGTRLMPAASVSTGQSTAGRPASSRSSPQESSRSCRSTRQARGAVSADGNVVCWNWSGATRFAALPSGPHTQVAVWDYSNQDHSVENVCAVRVNGAVDCLHEEP